MISHLVLKHRTVERGCILLSRATPVTAYMLQGNSDASKYSLNITGVYRGFFKYHWTQTQSFETPYLCVCAFSENGKIPGTYHDVPHVIPLKNIYIVQLKNIRLVNKLPKFYEIGSFSQSQHLIILPCYEIYKSSPHTHTLF